MFHITREITNAELKARATHYYKCFKHKLFFNPTTFCPSCGDLRPPLMRTSPGQIGISSPGQIWPNTIINVPYTGPIYGGASGGTTPVPGTIYYSPDTTTFTVSTGYSAPSHESYTVSMVGAGGGGGSVPPTVGTSSAEHQAILDMMKF